MTVNTRELDQRLDRDEAEDSQGSSESFESRYPTPPPIKAHKNNSTLRRGSAGFDGRDNSNRRNCFTRTNRT